MNRRHFTAAIVLGELVFVPTAGIAQEAMPPQRSGSVRAIIEGALAGVGFGVALVNPTGESWLLSDESAVMMFGFTGVASALVAQRRSADVDGHDTRRDRMRMAIGKGSETNLDYLLGYRAPVRPRMDVQGALLVGSHSWEKVERETRCTMFGCVTGDFVTDARYAQSVAAMIGAVFLVTPRSPASLTLSVGAGPVIANVENHEGPVSRKRGISAEIMVGGEAGTRSRWTAEAGARLDSAADTRTVLQWRIGRAFGY